MVLIQNNQSQIFFEIEVYNTEVNPQNQQNFEL